MTTEPQQLPKAQIKQAPWVRKSITIRAFTLGLLLLLLTFKVQSAPIEIAPTTNQNTGIVSVSGLNGTVYNFTVLGVPSSSYTIGNILNSSSGFNPVQVGSFLASTLKGINYGYPSSSDSQLLSTWLGSDGSSLFYNGASHIPQVFSNGSKTGTLLQLAGYIVITPSLVNTPITVSLGLDDGGTLTINGTAVIDNGGIHGATVISQQILFPVAGLYPIEIGYYDGHATQARLEAMFQGVTILTPVLVPTDNNSSNIQSYLNKVANTSPSDTNFNNAYDAIAYLALGGTSDPTVYANALKELSPLKYGVLTSQALGEIDFINSDLDDYLSHRRNEMGMFNGSNGLDLSGFSVLDGSVDPMLGEISEHLLAGGGYAAPGQIADSRDPVQSQASHSEWNQRWNVFTRGTAVLTQGFSNDGVQHNESTIGTFQLGSDYLLSPHLLAGSFFTYGHSNASLDSEGSEASADSYTPGLYASYTENGWYGNALTAYSFSNYKVTRDIFLPGLAASAQSYPNGQQEYTYLSGGRDYHINEWTLGPTAGLQYAHLSLGDFTEKNAGLLDLHVNEHDDDSLRSRLGGRIYYEATDGDHLWRPFLDASWEHEFMNNSDSYTSSFDGAGVGNFTITAPRDTRDSALISTGVDVDLYENISAFTVYRLQAGSAYYMAQSVEAGIKISF